MGSPHVSKKKGVFRKMVKKLSSNLIQTKSAKKEKKRKNDEAVAAARSAHATTLRFVHEEVPKSYMSLCKRTSYRRRHMSAMQRVHEKVPFSADNFKRSREEKQDHKVKLLPTLSHPILNAAVHRRNHAMEFANVLRHPLLCGAKNYELHRKDINDVHVELLSQQWKKAFTSGEKLSAFQLAFIGEGLLAIQAAKEEAKINYLLQKRAARISQSRHVHSMTSGQKRKNLFSQLFSPCFVTKESTI